MNKLFLTIAKNITSEIENREHAYMIGNSYTVVKWLKNIVGITYIERWDFEKLFNSILLDDLMNTIMEAFKIYGIERYCKEA